MISIIKYSKIYFLISATIVVLSVVAVALFRLKLGIDFTGGSFLEISLDNRISSDVSEIESILTGKKEGIQQIVDSAKVQANDSGGFIARFKNISEEDHQKILSVLNAELSKKLPKEEKKDESAGPVSESEDIDVSSISASDSKGNPVDVVLESPVITIGGQEVVSELRFESIGPTIGQELKNKAITAILAVLVAIVLYIAWAFRKVSEPVSSWKYGIIAIVALAHDVIIPTGIFAVLGRIYGIEIDILFVTALLTILGYSVNDTIVVFDKTRENLARDHRKHNFDWIVDKSINETLRRSLFTSLTTFLVLLAIYLFGGDSIKNFVLTLMIGIIAGTYSSIFLASPLLVAWERLSKNR